MKTPLVVLVVGSFLSAPAFASAPLPICTAPAVCPNYASGIGAIPATAGAVTTTYLADGSVDTAKIGVAAVTTAKLANSAVDTAKLATDSVTTAKIMNNAVDTSKINLTGGMADNAVLCKRSDGHIGECTSVVGVTGGCTCN